MLVVARRSLVDAAVRANEAMLLLEGSWPGEPSPAEPPRHALDDAIDKRFAALDVHAEQIAAKIVAAVERIDPAGPNFAELNVLRLRYAVVKWLRPIAWWHERGRSARGERVWLRIESPRDDEYEPLFRELAKAHGFSLAVDSDVAAGGPLRIALPANPLWRRLAGRLAALPLSGLSLSTGRMSARGAEAPRVLMSGNPRLLDPICDELLARGAAVGRLYDRFAFGCFRKYGRRVVQLHCDSSQGRTDPFPDRLLDGPLDYRGVDLAPVAECWYRTLRQSLAASQARLWSQIGRHVAEFRPTHVVVDEDATPQARALVVQARRRGVGSTVVQHGICGVRFGFAPLLADRFCAWEEGSRRQMEAWGVRLERIVVTGSPYQDGVAEEAAEIRPARRSKDETPGPRLLLIGTIPPRDDRPDSVAYHLTTRRYEELLRAVLAAVAEMEHGELAIRNHPRTGVDRALDRLLAAQPGIRHRNTSKIPIATDLAASDVVLSFPSSAALDAVRLGKPVIQLTPDDSHAVAPPEWYGFLGSAGNLPEIRRLLAEAFQSIASNERPTRTEAAAARRSASRIVDVVLEPETTAKSGIPAPHFTPTRRDVRSEVRP